MRRAAVVGGLSLLMLAGCRDAAISRTGLPFCSDVWVVGHTVPADYQGCDDGGGRSTPRRIDCVNGTIMFLQYDDMWTVAGKVMSERHSDLDKKLAACTEGRPFNL
jgi:hypothetical protein